MTLEEILTRYPTTSAQHWRKHDGGFVHCTAKLGDRVELADGVCVAYDARIANGVSIGANSFIGGHVVIGERTYIGDHVSVHVGAEIGTLVSIENHASIGPKAVIKCGSSIGRYADISPKSVIGPDVTVPDGMQGVVSFDYDPLYIWVAGDRLYECAPGVFTFCGRVLSLDDWFVALPEYGEKRRAKMQACFELAAQLRELRG